MVYVLVRQRPGDRRRATSDGTSFPVTVIEGWNTPWLRELVHNGWVIIPRTVTPKTDLPVITAYLLLGVNEEWVDFAQTETPLGNDSCCRTDEQSSDEQEAGNKGSMSGTTAFPT